MAKNEYSVPPPVEFKIPLRSFMCLNEFTEAFKSPCTNLAREEKSPCFFFPFICFQAILGIRPYGGINALWGGLRSADQTCTEQADRWLDRIGLSLEQKKAAWADMNDARTKLGDAGLNWVEFESGWWHNAFKWAHPNIYSWFTKTKKISGWFRPLTLPWAAAQIPLLIRRL